MVERVTAKRETWAAFEADDEIPEAAYVQAEDGRLQVMRCGACGKWSAPAEGHTVDFDGNVNPSVVHVPCGWHVWLRLEGWKPPTKPG